jgi:hypothetical protein
MSFSRTEISTAVAVLRASDRNKLRTLSGLRLTPETLIKGNAALCKLLGRFGFSTGLHPSDKQRTGGIEFPLKLSI